MDEKKYMIDGDPASARDIISTAKDLDAEYRRCGVCTTSSAARILRMNGRKVEENPYYEPTKERPTT